MKLMTLNAHSRPETTQSTAAALAELLTQQHVDVLALQEVNQRREGAAVDGALARACGAWETAASVLREDNLAWQLAKQLCRAGERYSFCYLPVKLGYGCYDEGLALLWRGEAQQCRAVNLSRSRDYRNWRRRMALGVRCGETWYYSLHTSRYDDEQEPFSYQWEQMKLAVGQARRVFLMGDLNCPAQRLGEGYARVLADGWRDAFACAAHTVGEGTASAGIDGWSDACTQQPLRIDYILTNDPRVEFVSCETAFDTARGQRGISDHCAVICHIGGDGDA